MDEQARAAVLGWQQTVHAAWDQLAAPAAEEPPPPLPGPPAGSDPREIADWWRNLSPADQLRYLNERPDVVGSLDGLPAQIRDKANRVLLDLAIADPQHQHNEERRESLAHLRDALEPRNGRQDFYLLGFDNAGDGRAIVARGNPDTAANVATLVPGIYNDITTVARSDNPREQSILERIDVLHREAGAQGSPSTSVIGWLGYDTPSDLGGTFNGGAADAARADLQSFQQGLRASHTGEPSHNTIIGHSYGGLVAGAAARDGYLSVDDFVSVASLGNGTQHASELRVPQVWATEHDADWYADLSPHGLDPTDIRYGANVFESDPPPGVELRSNPHSGPFDDVAGNVGLENIARIIADNPPPVLERSPIVNTFGDANWDPP